MSEYICPHCKNPIYDDEALLCHFCGESLRRTTSGGMGKLMSLPWKWVIVLLILVCFGYWVMRG